VIASDIAGLGRIRRFVSRLDHDDERLSAATVILTRAGELVGRVLCASEALARTAEQICYGIRLRRSNAAAYLASEPAALDVPFALAA
jgi:hypothetical protein